MLFNVQQEDIEILRQSQWDCSVKIELLNENFQTVEELQGNVIDDTWRINAESEIRREYTCTLFVTDSSFNIGENRLIWLDKYLRVYLGIKHLKSQNIRWYPIGIFLFNSASYEFNISTRVLNLTCSDMMSKLNGVRNGQLSALVTKIPVGSKIRDVLISTVTQLGNIKKYRIDDIGKEVPYDIEFSAGSYVVDIIAKLRDLYPGWETYFEKDGTFICQPIPTCKSDPIILDSSIIVPMVISENNNIDLSEIKNATEIWGKVWSTDKYTEQVTLAGSTYNLTIPSFTLTNYNSIGFKVPINNPANTMIKINNGTAYPLTNENGVKINAGILNVGKDYVIKFVKDKFIFCGRYQIHAIYKETNPDNPFHIKQKGDQNGIEEVLQVLTGDEFEKIGTDELALQRAEYETWKSTRLTNQIALEMVSIPWLDVNQKIEYTSFNTGITEQYIIKSIEGSTTQGTMTANMIKFYPLYPFIINS